MPYTPGSSSGVTADPQTPKDADAGAATDGVSAGFSRGDHRHHIPTAAPSALTPGAASSAGSSTALAAADHTHALPAFGTASGTFAQGSDARLSDDRVSTGLRSATTVVATSTAAAPAASQVLTASSPTAASWQALPSSVAPTRQVIAGTGLTGGGSLASDVSLAVSFGTSSTTVAVGNDSRLADDRTAAGIRTATTVVATSSAAAPASGSVLTATSSTAAAWQPLPASVGPSDTRLTDDRTASGLRSATTIVSTSTAAAPAVNAVLTATSGSAATWQALPAGVVPTRQIIAGTGLTGGGDLTSDRTLAVAFGTSASTACVGNDARLSDSRTPTGAAGGQLSGTYPSPSVVAVTSSSGALSIGAITDGQYLVRSGGSITSAAAGNVVGPTSSVDDNLPSFNGTVGAIQDSGISAMNLVQTTDPRLASMQQQQKYYRSLLPTAASVAGTSGTAYWIFIGRNGPTATVATRVFFWLTTAGTGTAVGEIALATTPAAPSRVAQTVTCVAALGNAALNTSLTAGALTVHQNSTAFAAPFPANAYCWLGIRTACTTAQPQIYGVTYDLGQGSILLTAASGVLTAGSNYAGTIVNPVSAATATTWLAPDLQLSLA